tara:strand:+ start:549 stop:2138 length:1590 start_codon:yes stop_codon:yes gene_type:complete
MKTQLLIFGLFFLCSLNTVQAQENDKSNEKKPFTKSTDDKVRILEYYHKKNKFELKPKSLKKDTPYKFKFIGINSGRVKASMKVQDKEIIGTLPESLKALNIFPGNEIKINKAIGNSSECETGNATQKLYCKTEQFIKWLNFINSSSSKLNEHIKKLDYNSTEMTKKMGIATLTVLLKTLEPDEIIENKVKENIKGIREDSKLKENTPKTAPEIDFDKLLEEIESMLDGLSSKGIRNEQQALEEPNKEGKHVKFLDDNKLQIEKFNQLIASSVEFIKSAAESLKGEFAGTNGTLGNTDITYDVFGKYAALSAILPQLDAKKLQSKFNYIVNSTKAQDYQNNAKEYYVRRDLLDIDVVLVDRFSQDTLLVQNLPVFSRGTEARLRFSTGFFYNNVVQKAYFLKARNDETKSVIQENGSELDIALGAQAHIGLKMDAWWDLSLNLGAAVSPLDGKTRYLIGVGILTGYQRRFGLSAGWAVSRVNVLSDAVITSEEGDLVVPIALESVPTVSRNKWGFYIGLTYNLSRVFKK